MGDRYDAMREIDAKVEAARALLQEAQRIAADNGVNFALEIGGQHVSFNGELDANYSRNRNFDDYWQGSGC